MKKILIIIPVIALVIVILLMKFGGGLGIGFGNGKGERNTPTQEQENEAEPNENDTSNENQEEDKENVIKVTVAGNDYFYENEKIELEVLIKNLKEIDDNFVVQIKDEKASKNAYEALINALKDNGIMYTD